ncbi:ATP-binding protein [Deltaproteobacteria bacterium TL4]
MKKPLRIRLFLLLLLATGLLLAKTLWAATTPSIELTLEFWIYLTGVLVVLLFSSFLGWNFLLKRKLKSKTAELAKSEEKFRAIVNSMSDIIFTLDSQGRHTGVFGNWVEKAGLRPEFFLGKTSVEILGETAAKVQQQAIAVALKGETYTYEWHSENSDGSLRYYQTSLSPLWSPEGNIIGLTGVGREISELKRAEKLLKEREEILNSFFNSTGMRMGVVELLEDDILHISDNSYSAQWFQTTMEAMKNQRESQLAVPQETLGLWRQQYLDCKDSGITQFTYEEGSQWFTATVTFIGQSMAGRPRFTYVVQNVSERKQMEEELRQAKIQADLANHAKSMFLANMSHEIRTPLNNIVGFSQIMLQDAKKESYPGQGQKHLQHIKANCDHLSELINNILDLSKIEAGKIEVTPESLNLKLLIQSIFHINKTQALRKDIQFNYEIDPQLPGTIYMDRTKLNQILMNLVDNAFKFTPDGKRIKIRALREKNQLLLQVEDEGIGISKDKKQRIFEPFEQADVTIRKKYGGTGLGLSMVQSLVGLMGGSIFLESEEEIGSVFNVRLPLVEAHEKELVQEELDWESIRFSPKSKILLVEDEISCFQMIQIIFQRMNLIIEWVDNSEAAIKKTLEMKPDVILMDVNMHGMDGIEATRKIRNLPEIKETPIIILSADAFIEQQQAARKAGVSDYLTKPLEFNKLIACLIKYLPQRETERIFKVPSKKPPLPDKIKDQLLQEFQKLSNIPYFMTGKIESHLQNMLDLSEKYDSPYPELLAQIDKAVFNQNVEQVKTLINEVLYG